MTNRLVPLLGGIICDTSTRQIFYEGHILISMYIHASNEGRDKPRALELSDQSASNFKNLSDEFVGIDHCVAQSFHALNYSKNIS